MDSLTSVMGQRLIFHQLYEACPKSLLNLALTSKSVYALAERFLYRGIHFDSYNPDAKLIPGYHKLVIYAQDIYFRPYKNLPTNPLTFRVFENLADLLSKCQRLRRLKYVRRFVPPLYPCFFHLYLTDGDLITLCQSTL